MHTRAKACSRTQADRSSQYTYIFSNVWWHGVSLCMLEEDRISECSSLRVLGRPRLQLMRTNLRTAPIISLAISRW